MTRIIYFLPLLVLGFLSVLFIQLLMKDPKTDIIDRAVSPFTLPLHGKEKGTLSDKDFGEDIIIVNFFASWCPPCAAELEQLETLRTEHHIKIYGIALNDSPKDLDNFLQKLGNPYLKIGLDDNRIMPPLWGASALPESFIVDKQGHIRYHHIGMVRPEHITDIFLPVIDHIKKER